MYQKEYYIYIMMNEGNTTSYIGVASHLSQRTWQHTSDAGEGFTKTYRLHKLVYYEAYDTAEAAIGREKQLKRWSRLKKSVLIRMKNPLLRDLSASLS